MALIRIAALAALIVAAAACGSSTGPHGGTPSGPIAFVAGNNQTDSIETTLTQALTVQVRAPSGQSSANQVVQFLSVPDSVPVFGQQTYGAYVEPLTSTQPTTFIAESLNTSGEATVGIVLGTEAGPAIVIVKVPSFGYVDTARFTVTPGNAVAIKLAPLDTTITDGSKVTLQSQALDTFGNPTSTPLQFSVSGPATLSGSTVTSTGVGQITVVASAGKFAPDTAHFTSVPAGQMAVSTGAAIMVMHLDGSGAQTILSGTGVGNVKWAPSGTSLVFDENSGGCTGSGTILQTTDLNGHLTTINNGGSFSPMYPSYSRDGTWIYFTENNGSFASTWRVHPDGTSADSLNSLNPAFDFYPSPSPNGQQIAYAIYQVGPGTTDLRILTVSTGAVTDLNTSAWAPSWSPTSNQIAYIKGPSCQSPLWIINADGTNARALSTDDYQGELDWSPDGQWLLGYDYSTNHINVINPTSGQTVQLPFSAGMTSPSWKPGSMSANRLPYASVPTRVSGSAVRGRRVQK